MPPFGIEPGPHSYYPLSRSPQLCEIVLESLRYSSCTWYWISLPNITWHPFDHDSNPTLWIPVQRLSPVWNLERRMPLETRPLVSSSCPRHCPCAFPPWGVVCGYGDDDCRWNPPSRRRYDGSGDPFVFIYSYFCNHLGDGDVGVGGNRPYYAQSGF